MRYKTYIDESGNTGPNLIDKDQKYFTFGAVSVPFEKEPALKSFILEQFSSVKEKEETEIKAAKWIRVTKRCEVLKMILEKLKQEGCFFSTIILEKRYMSAALIVDNFLDGAYNDIEDYTWCNDKEEKQAAAQYFYELLSDEDVCKVMQAFINPSLEKLKKSIDVVISKTKDQRYLLMLKGCHYKDLFDLEFDKEKSNSGSKRSPNYTSFCAFGGIIAKYLRDHNSQSDIIFDSCKMCDDSFLKVFEFFQHLNPNPILEEWAGMIPWKGIFNSFTVGNSKDSVFLQMADVIATSVLRTLEVLFDDKTFNAYQDYIGDNIKEMLRSNNFWYVMNDKYVQKLSQFYTN